MAETKQLLLPNLPEHLCFEDAEARIIAFRTNFVANTEDQYHRLILYNIAYEVDPTKGITISYDGMHWVAQLPNEKVMMFSNAPEGIYTVPTGNIRLHPDITEEMLTILAQHPKLTSFTARPITFFTRARYAELTERAEYRSTLTDRAAPDGRDESNTGGRIIADPAAKPAPTA